MLDIDVINYSLEEGGEVVGRTGRPLLDISSGVNGHAAQATLLEALRQGISSPMFHQIYDGPAGHPLARAAVRTFETVTSDHSLDLTDEHILITSGVSPAMHLLALYLADVVPDGELLLPVPTFPLAGASAAFTGLQVTEIVHEGDVPGLPSVEEIERAVGRRSCCIFLNLFNNPTGECYSADDLGALFGLARKHRLLVVVDRVSADLARDGPIPNVLDLAAEAGCLDLLLLISSVSKDRSLPGLRLGWVVGPRHIIDVLVRYNSHISMSSHGASAALIFLDMACRAITHNGALSQEYVGAAVSGVATAFRDSARHLLPLFDDAAPVLDRYCDISFLTTLATEYLGWRRDLVRLMHDNWRTIERRSTDGLTLGPEWQGGFNTFVRLPDADGADPHEFAVALFRRHGVQILPGPSFSATPHDWRRRFGFWSRLSFAMDRASFEEGVDILLRFASSHDEGRLRW